MEYYYSGTESLWWGNWNNLVWRRWKCEIDHPSQSTEVNLGKKQKWCSLWCPWSQVQQDTSSTDNVRILGCLWTIHHRCTYKWDWTEMLSVSFPLRAKTYEIRIVWIQKDVDEKRGSIRTHWNADCLLEDFYPKTTKILSTRHSRVFKMPSSEYLFLEPEFSFPSKHMFLRALKPNICIYGYCFWKWRRVG